MSFDLVVFNQDDLFDVPDVLNALSQQEAGTIFDYCEQAGLTCWVF